MKSSLFGLFSAVFVLPSAASAELLSQDAISGYTLGELPSTTSPAVTGYTGNWTDIDFGTAEPAVTAGSLSYAGANYAVGIGNKVSSASNAPGEITEPTSGRTYRVFDSTLTVTDSTAGVRYFSFLFQSGQETGATTYQTLALYNTNTADANRNFDIGIITSSGQTGTQYNFGVDNAYTTTGVAANTSVHLLVVKFDLSATAASDAVTVWVDPVLGAGEPTGGVTVSGKNLTWDRLAISDYDGNSCAWDEIRWGTTFDSVTTEAIVSAVPTFTLQPADFSGNVGGTVTLVAQADSDPAPSFQWEKSEDGSTGWTEILDATSATLEIVGAAYSDNGFYRVIADNGNVPTATSNIVQVSLTYPAPTIYTQPASTAVQVGSDVTLSVVAGGLGNLTYQWFDENGLIDGEVSDTLTLTNIQLASAGNYYVEITDDAGLIDEGISKVTISNTALVSVFSPWSELVSYEPFDTAAGYAVGELPGQAPSITGYSGVWTDIDFGNAEPAVTSGSLIYSNPSYLGSTGDKVAVATNITGGEVIAGNSGRVYRPLDAQLVANDSTTGTRYLSLLFQSGQETGVTSYQMLELKTATHTDFNRCFDIGLSNNGGMTGSVYDFSVNGTYAATGVAADTNVHLMVVKFELSATTDQDNVTVWIDPALGAGEPTGGTTITGTNLNWDRLALSDFDGNSAAWDEIRWGSTFNSVTLNPNPPDDFAAWIAGYPGVGSLTGFNDDADGDGIKNGVENFMGTDPSVSGQGIVQVAKSGNTITFQHPQNASAASDVTAAYRWSVDLVTFHADGETVGGTTIAFTPSLNTPSAGTTSVSAAITGTVPSKVFVDLKVTKTP
jgi:hypothetical protein